MKVLVLHGPNLGALGERETSVYGSATLAEINQMIEAEAEKLQVDVEIHQTDHEGELIGLLHRGSGRVESALFNPAAYSHTSRALADAIRSVPYPVIEVHLSNIHSRETWRQHSVTAEAAHGLICGLGPGSYIAALQAVVAMLRG